MIPGITVRHNEKGSVSLSRAGGGYIIMRVQKQTRLGDIEAEYEISLEPNSRLHVTASPEPQPESCECHDVVD